MAETRHIVRDLFQPNALVYWADFLISWSVAMVCFALVRRFPLFSWQQIGLFLISSVLIYRAALFIHEIVHLRTGTFRAFREGRCGIGPLGFRDADRLSVRIGAEVRGWRPEDHFAVGET